MAVDAFAGTMPAGRLEVQRRNEALKLTIDPDIYDEETFAPGLDGVVREMLELLGQDTERDGLLKTPTRVARSLSFLTSGYNLDPREVVGSALFEAEYDEIVDPHKMV